MSKLPNWILTGTQKTSFVCEPITSWSLKKKLTGDIDKGQSQAFRRKQHNSWLFYSGFVPSSLKLFKGCSALALWHPDTFHLQFGFTWPTCKPDKPLKVSLCVPVLVSSAYVQTPNNPAPSSPQSGKWVSYSSAGMPLSCGNNLLVPVAPLLWQRIMKSQHLPFVNPVWCNWSPFNPWTSNTCAAPQLERSGWIPWPLWGCSSWHASCLSLVSGLRHFDSCSHYHCFLVLKALLWNWACSFATLTLNCSPAKVCWDKMVKW